MKNKLAIIIALVLLSVFVIAVFALELPKLFSFNKKDALDEWEEKIFKNRVMYTVEIKEGRGCLEAKSEAACSGLIYKMDFDPKEYPMISWWWKVDKFPDKSKADEEGGWIEKDDYAARVYVIFPSWDFNQIRSLEYVWDERLEEGTILTSPYFENIKLVVAQSGRAKAGEWIFEERNISEDYKKAFGEPPERNVGAISVMTDTDNTLSTAEASYKNLKVGYENDKTSE